MKTPHATVGALGLLLLGLGCGLGFGQSDPPGRAASPVSLADRSGPAQSAVNAGHVLPETAPAVPWLSPWTREIVKLARAGIEEPVMLAFIGHSGTFNLGADQLVYLRDLGVSEAVLAAMVQHDAELAAGLRPLTSSSVPTAEPAVRITSTPGPDAKDSIRTAAPGAAVPPASAEAQRAQRSYGETQPAGVASDLAPVAAVEGTDTSDYALDPPAVRLPSPPTREAKRSAYPVREPYPVELTAPIIFVNAAGRTPNLLIIELFP